jgi:hypothetical protein
MPGDPRRRQKKLERRSAKRKEKKQVLGREQNAGLAERLTQATGFPVLDCWIGDSIEEQGIGWVVLSRQLPDGFVAVASFLVDPYCLGVKGAWAEVLARPSYDSKYTRKMHRDLPARTAPPAEARKLLEGAVAYARGLGLAPHPDYPKAMLLFGSVDPAESDAVFEFGKDGQPYFIAGPNDTPERCRKIMAILHDTCGPGRFHFLIPMATFPVDNPFPDVPGRGDPPLAGPDEGEDAG